jgi:hypothetical protein
LNAEKETDVLQGVFNQRPDCGISFERKELGQHQTKIEIFMDSGEMPEAGSGVQPQVNPV